jgi:predicted nucleic acid-binding protein
VERHAKLRIYVDTSVFGGYFDEPFKQASRRLFHGATSGEISLLISELVTTELLNAPQKVKGLLLSLPSSTLGILPLTREVEELSQAYLDAGILTPNSENDALHVATAAVHRVDAIVSWNFKHIVQLGKMRGYNEVNLAMGYPHLYIASPMELFR